MICWGRHLGCGSGYAIPIRPWYYLVYFSGIYHTKSTGWIYHVDIYYKWIYIYIYMYMDPMGICSFLVRVGFNSPPHWLLDMKVGLSRRLVCFFTLSYACAPWDWQIYLHLPLKNQIYYICHWKNQMYIYIYGFSFTLRAVETFRNPLSSLE